MYGDLDVSVLDEMPKNRLPVKTYLIEPDLLPRAMALSGNLPTAGSKAISSAR